MKIGVLADTHMNNIEQLPRSMLDSLRRTDLIVHLGDYDSLDVVHQLSMLGDFLGITGNHDGPEICSLLPEQEILEVKGKRLALVHGHGCVMPFGFRRGLLKRFKGERIDAVLYGHTHVIKNMYHSDVLFFNPGSAVGRFPSSGKSYGILTVGASIHSEIFYVSEKVYSGIPRFILPGTAKPELQKVPAYNPYTRNS
jgi:putative phosphoesterase